VLASQVDAPHLKKTPVSTLAAVLERLAPRPAPPSLRETVPGLVRAAPPRMDTEVNAVRAALEEKTVRAAPGPPRAEQPAVETIAIQSAPAPAPAVVGEAPAAVAGPTVVVEGKPEVAAPVVEAPVAEAVSEPVAPVVAEVVAVPETEVADAAEPELPLNGAEPV